MLPSCCVVCRRLKEASECEREIRTAQAELSKARAQLAARSAEVCGCACVTGTTVRCSWDVHAGGSCDRAAY